MTTKKRKRKLNGKFLALVAAVILLCLSIYKVPRFIDTNKLLDLGYSDEAISAIYAKKLKKVILKNSYYSDYLNEEICKDDFNKDYIRLYVLCDDLDQDHFDLYERLKAKRSYNDEELEKIFSSLKIYNVRPLLIFDKVEDIDGYIDDCKRHSDNSETVFEVDGDYLHPYENYLMVEEKDKEDVYISSKSYLGEYEPTKLVEVNTQNGVPGVMLDSRALAAFYELCDAIREEDLDMAIYATGGYISFEDQQLLYSQNPTRIKEGFTDAQTGLGVYVTNEEANIFGNTRSYKWLLENAWKYGFIQRFPEGKVTLTGHYALSNYFRYVGKELAAKIHESGMCFDEYYFNYIY